MGSDERHGRWEARYREADGQQPAQALQVLRDNDFLLPRQGQALDMACGRGGNALFLASHGLDVSAWDYARPAIASLQEQARTEGLTLNAEVRDVVAEPPEPGSFDVICVGYFLQRELAPAIAAALRPAGLLFYETFIREAVSDCGPGNPAYRLAPNELLDLFGGLRVVEYREHGLIGDLSRGRRDIASLVAYRH